MAERLGGAGGSARGHRLAKGVEKGAEAREVSGGGARLCANGDLDSVSGKNGSRQLWLAGTLFSALMNKKREEFKEWHNRHRALEQSFEDNLATHEALLDSNEKAHSFLHAQRDEPIAKDSIRATCDLIVENICAPIIVATNLSCSTSKATPLSDPPLIHLPLWKMRPSRRRMMRSPMH